MSNRNPQQPTHVHVTGGVSATGTPGTIAQTSHPGYDLSIQPEIDALGPDEIDYLVTSVRELIARRIEGIHYAESRRSQILTISGALGAIGVALLPLCSATHWLPLRSSLTAFAVTSIAVGSAVWIMFTRQTNYSYPFIDEANTRPINWKWFYRNALVDSSAFGPKFLRGHSKTSREQEKMAYRAQWTIFTKQINGLANAKVDATQDLKQLYLLHVDERYKNLFLTHLRRLLLYGVILIGTCSMVAFGVSFYFVPSDVHTSVTSQAGVTVRTSWKESGGIRESGLSVRDIEFKFTLSVENASLYQFPITDLLVKDDSGDPIPIDLETDIATVTLIPVGAKREISGYFWVAASDRDHLKVIATR